MAKDIAAHAMKGSKETHILKKDAKVKWQMPSVVEWLKLKDCSFLFSDIRSPARTSYNFYSVESM
jgi:hypothetical protein